MSGQFSFDALETGENYRLLASIEDYARGDLPLRLGPDEVDSTLRLHRVALDPSWWRRAVMRLPAGCCRRERVEALDLANQPNVADDPIRALRRLPGVVQGGLSAASNLRGGETSEVLVLLDGFPLRQPFHLPGYQSPFSLLEEDLIDSIDVFTGGFPARYGNRLAGVFDIESAEAAQAPKTAIGISFINARARSAGERTMAKAAGVPPRAREPCVRCCNTFRSTSAGPSYSDLSLTVHIGCARICS